jgi:hypothetical protein
MLPPRSFRAYLVAVLRRSFQDWHEGEGWFALSAYFSILLLPFLVTGWVRDLVGDFFQTCLALAASIWLVILVLVMTPFRLWREVDELNEDLHRRLDEREKRRKALGELGKVWEDATHYLNDVVQGRTIGTAEIDKLTAFEQAIYDQVDVISPGETSMFRTIGSYNVKKHPAEYHPEFWSGDKRLVIFSERLLRVRRFLNKHTPPLVT